MKFPKIAIAGIVAAGFCAAAPSWPTPSSQQMANQNVYPLVRDLLQVSAANDRAANTSVTARSESYRAKAAELNSLITRLDNGEEVPAREVGMATRR